MIPFLNLEELNRPFLPLINQAINKVLQSGRYILEEHVENFEDSYADFCESAYCIGVANGSQAIELILRAWNFPPKSEIIVPANTYIATVLPLLHLKLRPIFVEPDPDTLLINPDLLEKAITTRTKAIIPVHLYGKCCDMDRIYPIAQRYQLAILTDAAQAHDASYKGRVVGSLAQAEAFSFYPTKNLGAMGDAGAIVTNDATLAAQLRALRNYGFEQKNVLGYSGINSRLDALQAAILQVKLPYLHSQNKRRRQIAAFYSTSLSNPLIELPDTTTMYEDAWHLYAIRCTTRDRLQHYLYQKGIETQIHYPIPPYRQTIFQSSTTQYPITDKLSSSLLSLPLNPTLTDEEIAYIVATVNNFR